jgi:hypothetical protein
VDDDCDGLTDEGLTFTNYYVDSDGDGYGVGAAQSLCYNPGAGFATVDGDCNDANAAINPAAQEVCDNIDNDCDGLTDDADPSITGQSTWYADADGDTYGNASVTQLACVQPVGYVANNTDCNDANAAVNPAATEICNGIDDDCDGLTDDADPSITGQSTWYADADGDTYGNASVTQLACVQPVGYVANNTDCNDANAAINPGATEICNGIDDDCDGATDDGLTFINYFSDNDGDTWGGAFLGNFCVSPGGTAVTTSGDCNDANPAVYPGATEVCNGIDDDCDGLTDEGIPVPPLGTITGPFQQCIPIGAGTATFSVPTVLGVTTYTWNVPAGMTITSGQGTNTITVSWTSTAVHDGILGMMTVTPGTACGSGTPSGVMVDINYTVPVRPPSISGPAKLCPGDAGIYSTGTVARARTYTWTVPTGMTIVSGQGTNIINVITGPSYTGGTVSVACNNTCGTGPSRSRTVSLNIPGTPAPISGQATGLCNSTGVVFSTTGTPEATSYLWSVPPGVTIVSGQGTGTITVNVSNTFTTGSINVTGQNSCGFGLTRSLTIFGTPGQAGPISGPTAICPGATGIVYQVATVAGADVYTWTVPAGATIVSGQGTKIITVDYNTTPASGLVISVRTSNNCGLSPIRSLSGISVNSANCGGPRSGDNSAMLSGFSIFPNPATDRITLNFETMQDSDYRIRITDVAGRLVFTEEGAAVEGINRKDYAVDHLNGGIYFVTLETAGETQVIRLMVE